MGRNREGAFSARVHKIFGNISETLRGDLCAHREEEKVGGGVGGWREVGGGERGGRKGEGV